MTDVLTQLCSELADLTERNARQDAMLDEHTDRNVELCEMLGVSEPEGLLTAVADLLELREAVGGAFDEIEENTDLRGKTDRKDPGSLYLAVRLANDAAYEQGKSESGSPEAADALRRYLVRQGLPADPVRLDDPDLWALYEALSDS